MLAGSLAWLEWLQAHLTDNMTTWMLAGQLTNNRPTLIWQIHLTNERLTWMSVGPFDLWQACANFYRPIWLMLWWQAHLTVGWPTWLMTSPLKCWYVGRPSKPVDWWKAHLNAGRPVWLMPGLLPSWMFAGPVDWWQAHRPHECLQAHFTDAQMACLIEFLRMTVEGPTGHRPLDFCWHKLLRTCNW